MKASIEEPTDPAMFKNDTKSGIIDDTKVISNTMMVRVSNIFIVFFSLLST